MRSFLQLAVLSLAVIQTAAIFGFEKASHVPSSTVFGVSRGGGLFGGGNKDAKVETAKYVLACCESIAHFSRGTNTFMYILFPHFLILCFFFLDKLPLRLPIERCIQP